AGFAPVNNPAVTVLVVLDSPATYPHDQGGDVAAPLFSRIAQQVLAYMNVPHDVDVQDPKRLWARAHANQDDVSEGAPDYIASQQPASDAPAGAPVPATTTASSAPAQNAQLPQLPSNAQLKTVAA